MATFGLHRLSKSISYSSICLSLLTGYEPKSGFLQTQIKRLPMLHDLDFEETESRDKFGIDRNPQSSSLEELVMP